MKKAMCGVVSLGLIFLLALSCIAFSVFAERPKEVLSPSTRSCSLRINSAEGRPNEVLSLSKEEVLSEVEGRSREGIGQWLQEIGFFTGYIQADLKYQDDMQAVPLGVRFGFDLKPFTKKFGLELKGMLELIYEIFVSPIFEPEADAEMGVGSFLRYSYPLTAKLYPYIEVGSGLYYMTLQTYEQSTQFNFASAGGAGLTYFLRDDLAISVGYRKRHVSNASIKEPNAGIDADVYLAGMSWYF